MNARLGPEFDDEAETQVQHIITALASIGLDWHPHKSLAVALRGRTFSPAERERLDRLRLPFKDSATPAADRGFVTVGVPTGTADYTSQHLEQLLFDKALWRLAWQLRAWRRVTCMRLCRFSELPATQIWLCSTQC